MERFLFAGGDLRMLYAAEYLNKERDCLAYGFEALSELPVKTVSELISCDTLVLPLPLSSDGENFNAPYHGDKLTLDVLNNVKEGGRVFAGGSMTLLEKYCREKGLRLYNYLSREELQIMNAVPTAEGTLEIMLKELSVTVWGLKVLITGFGRVGEAMAKTLMALGAEVTVCARRPEQLARAENMFCKTVDFESGFEKGLPRYDAIINTVPAPLFDKENLKLLKKDCLLIDLASRSCIENSSDAEGSRVIWALSLPGKTAPITAGKIIGRTIQNILREEERDGAV